MNTHLKVHPSKYISITSSAFVIQMASISATYNQTWFKLSGNKRTVDAIAIAM